MPSAAAATENGNGSGSEVGDDAPQPKVAKNEASTSTGDTPAPKSGGRQELLLDKFGRFRKRESDVKKAKRSEAAVAFFGGKKVRELDFVTKSRIKTATQDMTEDRELLKVRIEW